MAEAKTLLKDARKAVDDNDFERAIAICKEVLKKDGKNYMALVLLGMALRGDPRAVAAFKKAISLKGNNPLAYQGLAKVYENEGSDDSLMASLETNYKIVSFPGVNETSVFKNMYDTACKIQNSETRADMFDRLLDAETDNLKKNKLINFIMQVLKNTVGTSGTRLLLLFQKIIKATETPDEIVLVKYFECTVKERGHDKALEIFWETQHKTSTMIEWFCKILVECSIHDIMVYVNLSAAENLIFSIKEEKAYPEIAQMAEVVLNMRDAKFLSAYDKILKIVKPKMRIEIAILYVKCCIYLGRYIEAENSIETHLKHPSRNFDICIKKLLFVAKALQHKPEKCLEALNMFEVLKTSNLGELEKTSLFCAFLYLEKFNDAESSLINLTNSFEYRSLRARLLYKMGKTEEAVKLLLEDEDNHSNQLQLGKIYYKRKDYDNSFDILLRFAAKNKDNFKVFLYLGDIYAMQKKHLERAKKCYLKVFELNPECSRAGKSLSDIYVTLKDWVNNENLLKSLTESYMETNSYQLHWAWLQFSRHCIAMENWDNAVMYLRTYIRLEPTDVDAWEILADAYYSRGSYTSAMKCYNKTVELDPLRKYCQLQIGSIQCLLGFLKDALDTYTSIHNGSYLPAFKGLAEVKIALAKENFSKNLFGLCRDNAQGAIDLISDQIINQTKLPCFWRLFSNAISIIIKLPPKYNWLYFNSSGKLQKYENIQMFDLNISYICKTIHMSELTFPYLLHELALMYMKYYDISKNVKYIRKAYLTIYECITLEKGKWQHWNLLGVVCMYKAIDKPKSAQHAFMKALKLDPINSTLWSNLGVYYLVLGNHKLANRSFKKAQEGNPAFVQSWVGQALIAESIGHHEAMDLFRHASQLEFNKESSLGYSYCVSKSLLSADDSDSSNLLYSIKNMHAIPAASDLMLLYNGFENECACSWNTYGILLENMGHFNKAVEAFSNAYNFSVEENRECILLNLARNYMHLENYEYVAEILNLIPYFGVKLAYTLALSYYKKEEYEESYRIYSEILQHLDTDDDDKIFIFIALTNIAYKSKDFETAKYLSLQTVELYKTDSQIEALLTHFALSILIGDEKISIIIMNNIYNRFRKALCENPIDEFNPFYFALQKFLIHESYFYLTFKNARCAIKNLSSYMHFQPNLEKTWKIMTKLTFENLELTNLSVKKYLNFKNNTDNIESLKLACISELLLGNYSSSVKYAQKVIRIQPDNVESWSLLIPSLCKMQQSDNFGNEKLSKALNNFIISQPKIKADLEGWLAKSMAIHTC